MDFESSLDSFFLLAFLRFVIFKQSHFYLNFCHLGIFAASICYLGKWQSYQEELRNQHLTNTKLEDATGMKISHINKKKYSCHQ